MKTLYSLLNANAKSWWYFKRLREWGKHDEARAKERESIRNCIANVRESAASQGYLVISDDGSRYYLMLSRGGMLSGYGDAAHLQRLCSVLKVPVYDLRTARKGNSVIWNEPSDSDFTRLRNYYHAHCTLHRKRTTT